MIKKQRASCMSQQQHTLIVSVGRQKCSLFTNFNFNSKYEHSTFFQRSSDSRLYDVCSSWPVPREQSSGVLVDVAVVKLRECRTSHESIPSVPECCSGISYKTSAAATGAYCHLKLEDA
jgi:hypothetical protein